MRYSLLDYLSANWIVAIDEFDRCLAHTDRWYEYIQEEWETRKTLAPGISTPEMDQAYARAKKIANIAFKVCGAGGGGCFFILLPEKNKALKDAVQKTVLEAADIRALPFDKLGSSSPR